MSTDRTRRTSQRVVTVWLSVVAPTLAQTPARDASKKPPGYEHRDTHDPNGIGKFYMGREIAQVMGHLGARWLDRPERETEEQPAKLLDALKIEPGMTVADIGAGTGYFSFRIAKRVAPAGKVLAVDIQPEMLDIIRARMKERKVTNIRPIRAKEKNPNLPAGSCDLIILVDVYHEFSYPYEVTRALVRALKPGGRLVFVEYRMEDPDVPIKLIHKMSQAQVKKEMAVQSAAWLETIDVLPRQHIIIFQKPPRPPDKNRTTKR